MAARIALADESIYALLPPAPVRAQRRGLGESTMHSSAVAVAPSYSTFPSAHTRDGAGATLFRGPHAPIGRLVGDTVDPQGFLRRGAGTGGGPGTATHDAEAERSRGAAAAAAAGRSRSLLTAAGDAAGAGGETGGDRKAPVPSRAERPVMGLTTDKNFVHSNAVDVICSPPRNVRREPLRPTELPGFAKVPAYLGSIRAAIAAEHGHARALHDDRVKAEADRRAQYVRELPEDERDFLSRGLRKAWAERYRGYQALPFAKDTALQIARKEKLERELKEIEASLERLERPVLFVHRDDTVGVAAYSRAEALRESERKARTLVQEAIAANKSRH
jgi:hypothetical protein